VTVRRALEFHSVTLTARHEFSGSPDNIGLNRIDAVSMPKQEAGVTKTATTQSPVRWGGALRLRRDTGRDGKSALKEIALTEVA